MAGYDKFKLIVLIETNQLREKYLTALALKLTCKEFV